MSNYRKLPRSADAVDQWEWDRQQNIIDVIDQTPIPTSTADGEEPTLSPEEKTLLLRKNEAKAVQMYLYEKATSSDAADAAVDEADAAWIAENPKPIKGAPDDEAG